MDRTRSSYNVLANTLIANVTTSFLWFALTCSYRVLSQGYSVGEPAVEPAG
ncbi:MAG TPA: hypothetical protein VGK17_03455 [Propionicimonas sp.]